MTGTRPGGAIAAAWAVMNHLGEDGYMQIADRVMRTTVKLRQGIDAMEGVKVLGDPAMSILAIGSDGLNVYEVADELSLRGWHLDRQQLPPSLHLTVTPAHAAAHPAGGQVADRFLADLEDAIARVRKPSWRKLANSVQVGLVRAAVRLLPQRLVSDLTGRAAALTGASGTGLPTRSAAMYGMMASLPNKGDLNEFVLDLLDSMTRPEEAAESEEAAGVS